MLGLVMRMRNELYHYGVKGMKWGVRRTPEELGYKNLRKARTSNLEKWGKDSKSNVLYIAGYSGSGKSTTALGLANSKHTVIHLDAYSEPDSGGTATIRNRQFDKYLDKKVPGWRRMSNATQTGENGSMKRHSNEYWNTVDALRGAIETFGELEHKSGRKVIVEGVQIADDWLSANKNYYKDKPMVILSTNPVSSLRRAFERDDKGGIIKGLKSVDSAKQYIQWYKNTGQRLNDLAVQTNAKRGQDYLNQWLKENY